MVMVLVMVFVEVGDGCGCGCRDDAVGSFIHVFFMHVCCVLL